MENNCINHEMVFVKRIKSNGSYLLNKQCLSCGEHDSKAYSFNLVNNIEAVVFYSEELRNQLWENQKKQRESERINEKELWFKNHYTPYLNSKEWKEKRKKVLNRDKYICQACLTSKATEVHHLTYIHVFNEPLFELVSICNHCHTLITKLDRE